MLCSLELHFYCFYECVCFHLHTCCVCVYTCWYGVCACAHVCVAVCLNTSEDTLICWTVNKLQEVVSSSAMLTLGHELRSSGLITSTFTHQATPCVSFSFVLKFLIKSNSCYWCPVWESFAKSKTTKTYLYVLFYNLDRLVLRVALLFELILV